MKKVLISLFIVFLVIGITCFVVISTMNKNGNEENDIKEVIIEKEKKDKYEISLKLDNKDDEVTKNKILIDIPDEIDDIKITLPDGNVVKKIIDGYDVKKNGTYKFIFEIDEDNIIEKEIEVSNIKEINEEDLKPEYIPEGFSYKEGTVNTGYVIVDQYGNEFVWVPVENGYLYRENDDNDKYEENEEFAKGLVSSVASYYGFYISRYEATKAEFEGNIVATTIAETEPWTDVNYIDAKNASEDFARVFEYQDVRSSLVSSYAWDSTLKWIDESNKKYSTSENYGNYTDTIKLAGENLDDCVNNIFDMAGNVKEWTSELYLKASNKDENDKTNNKTEVVEENANYRVVRGGCVELTKSASSKVSYNEELTNPSWGFRLILYK